MKRVFGTLLGMSDEKFVALDCLDYKDVFIVPQYSEVSSRKNVDTTVYMNLGDKTRLASTTPVISSNMDTVTDSLVCIEMARNGAIGCLHRFMSIEENVKEFKRVQDAVCQCFVSVGVNEESKERARALYHAGARHFCIDIAHGHSKLMKEMVSWVKKNLKGVTVMAGNVATPHAVYDLATWGVDVVKCGIGPGCFAAGTRILMSDGTYKNIEHVVPGDRIINKDGNPATVKASFSTGTRETGSYRTNVGRITRCTPEHLHWIGDLSTTKKTTISNVGYKGLLDKKSKTIPKKSKYKWENISNASTTNSVLLMPRNINFEMPSDFSVALNKKSGGTWRTGLRYEKYAELKPTYECGYIFGTFLGDGCANCTVQKNGSHIGSVNWSLGLGEMDIAEKLSLCIEKTFGRPASSIKKQNGKNVINVRFSDKPLADFLNSFGKKDKKHLPNMLLVNNKDYLQGIYDGLIDTDGSIYQEKRHSFSNTSTQLLELFYIATYILYGHFPNLEKKQHTMGNLKGAKLENFKEAYVARPLIAPKNRLTKDYQVVKILESDFDNLKREIVYDLEIDDETHSFIANNTIVHNSACLTKNVTGATFPQFSAVQACAKEAKRCNIQLVADGGVREIADICKAIAAGADFVMCGRLFAGAKEAPGARDDQGRKLYRGSASADVMKLVKSPDALPTPEGASTLIEASNQTIAEVVAHIQGGLQSSMSYTNAHTIKEFQQKVRFGIRYANYT